MRERAGQRRERVREYGRAGGGVGGGGRREEKGEAVLWVEEQNTNVTW